MCRWYRPYHHLLLPHPDQFGEDFEIGEHTGVGCGRVDLVEAQAGAEQLPALSPLGAQGGQRVVLHLCTAASTCHSPT